MTLLMLLSRRILKASHRANRPQWNSHVMTARLAILIGVPLIALITGCGLQYNHQPSGSSADDSAMAPGAGNGTGPGPGQHTLRISVNPMSLSWAGVNIGHTSIAKTITIANPSKGYLAIASLSQNSNFVVKGDTCPIGWPGLRPGATCQLSVVFRPVTTGAISEDLTITSDAASGPQTVRLSGTGGVGSLLFSPPALYFPKTTAGASSTQQHVVLMNISHSAITMSAITYTNMFPETNDCTPTLAAGSSCTFAISFAPQCSGSKAGAVTVQAGDDTVQLYLAGDASGTTVCRGQGMSNDNTGLWISPGRLVFGDQLVGSVTTSQVVVTNDQSYDVSIGDISIPKPFSETNNCPDILPEGFSCKINISYSPLMEGYSSEELRITNSGSAAPQALPVTGNGVE